MRGRPLLAGVLALTVATSCPRGDGTAAKGGGAPAAPGVAMPGAAPVAVAASRPPHPTMASALWGEQVAADLGRTVAGEPAASAAESRPLLTQAVVSLHTLQPGDEARARRLATRAWQAAPDDATRSTALAVAALAMVLDPAVEGYTERLTDAFGLAAWAGTLDAGDGAGQAARAVVGAAAGAVRQARALIDLLAATPKLPDDTRGLLALARDGVRDRSDALHDDLEAGLRARPDSARLRAIRGERLLELGLVDDALALVKDAREPALVILAGRALVLADRPADAVARLQPLVEPLAGVDEPRRAEAMAWLGLAQARDASRDPEAAAAARATQTALSPRPGWAREAALIEATVLLGAGDLEAGRRNMTPLAQGTPTSTLLVERVLTGALLDTCGALGDAPCVERAARRLRLLDVDDARVLRARAAVVAGDAGAARPADAPATDAGAISADAGSPDAGATSTDAGAPALQQEADRLAPGTPAQQARLLAVRRARVARCLERARSTLDTLLAEPELRVARALAVPFRSDPLARAKQAAAAVGGRGAPLAEDDLVDVIDALGGARLKDSEALFSTLGADPRPRIRRAVARARDELKDPEARRRRLTSDDDRDPGHDEHGDHGDGVRGGPALPGDAPVPRSPR